MTAEDLKKSILQEAIQGKLAPQIASEGTGKELLEKILKEKAELIKEGKLKKEKTLEPIKEDEIPFDIPESWCWCRLGEIVYKLTDGTHSTPKYVSEGIPFLSVKNLSSGKINLENTKFITKKEHDELKKRCNPEYGDILLTKVGTTGIPVLNDLKDEFSLFVSVALLKFNHEYIDEKFFVDLLASPLVQIQAKENTKGVGNKNWVINDIANTLVLLPPLAEQQRIVDAIEKFMPLIDEYGKREIKLNLLNEVIGEKTKKATLQEAISGTLTEGWRKNNKVTETGKDLLEKILKEKAELIKEGKIKKEKPLEPINEEEIPFDIPESWCWCRMGEIADIIMGQSPSGENVGESIKGMEFHQGKIYFSKRIIAQSSQFTSEVTKIAPKNSILLCMRAPVGKINITDRELCIGRGLSSVKPKLNIPLDFLYYVLLTKENELNKKATGSTFKAITRDVTNNILIALPPLEEQKQIVKTIESLLPLCDKLGK